MVNKSNKVAATASRCLHSRLDPLHSAITEPNQLGHTIDADALGELGSGPLGAANKDPWRMRAAMAALPFESPKLKCDC
jgi:hypothetical protein